jgi:hypothetical protein
MTILGKISISYIGDLKLLDQADIFLVQSETEYVEACNRITQEYIKGTQIEIWVRKKTHFVWLQAFSDKISCNIKFQEKTPRILLSDQWNVDIPDWLSDSMVIDQSLLEIDVTPLKTRSDFSTITLSHFLGPAFKEDIFNPNFVVELLSIIVSPETKQLLHRYPILENCLKAKCSIWGQSSDKTWIKEFCDQLHNSPEKLWNSLSIWACLHGYPEKLLAFTLSLEEIAFVRKIPVEHLYKISLEPTAKDQINTQIELFFNDVVTQIKSNEEFRKVLNFTSGKLGLEFRRIKEILLSNHFEPTKEDILGVQEKFANCLEVRKNELNLLLNFVRPDRPSLLEKDEKWDSSRWIDWTVNEYIPYRHWQTHNLYFDKELEDTVCEFSEWYLNGFIEIHNNIDLSLIHSLSYLSEEENTLAILLIIDCLPITFYQLIHEELQRIGLHQQDLSFKFSAIPTITEFNKPGLVSGIWAAGPADYTRLLKDRSSQDWNGRRTIYTHSIKGLSELDIGNDPAIVLLNLIEGDEILHSDVESVNSTHSEELRRLFSRLAEAVQLLSKKWTGSLDDISVSILTDHGACRLLDEEKHSFESSTIQNLFSNEKHRFASIDKTQEADVPQNLWDFGIKYTHPFAANEFLYFLPKGHNTVKRGARGSGYQHGGITPEEVIVPLSKYKFKGIEWQDPISRFLNLASSNDGSAYFYVQRLTELKIEIQNPNSKNISVTEINIITPDTDLKSYDSVKISAHSSAVIKLTCYFQKSALDVDSFSLEVMYEISGELHKFKISLECEFKTAMTGGFDLKNL